MSSASGSTDGGVRVVQAYRFALDPAPARQRMLCSHAGAARFAWNWGLARCQQRYQAEGRWYSGMELHKLWNAGKKADPALAWWAENSKCVNQVERAIPDRHARPGSAIGVDLGVRTLLTGVDDRGTVVTVPGPKALRSSLRRLRRASRAHSRKAKGSANRREAAARLARVHARVAAVRADALHKATSGLAARYETVVAEDLNVAGMTRNRRLARAIADQGFGMARRMFGYKTAWNGGSLLLAGRWFPSSKMCSGCGAVKAKLPLSERTYRCQSCGLVTGRDVNAAVNLLKLAASGAESLNACGGTVRPGLAGRVPVNQEPGTARAGQTGTASGQPLTAE